MSWGIWRENLTPITIIVGWKLTGSWLRNASAMNSKPKIIFNPKCHRCLGVGWVCENHIDKPWDDDLGCICGAGLPCECNIGEDPETRVVLIEENVTWH